MDMRRLAIRGTFGTVLCPYSVITYAHEVDAGLAAVRGLAAILAPGGRLALDAFVPRPVELGVTTQDYRVPFRGGSLERHKRIEEQGDGTNVIRRFYRIYDASGDEAGSVDTVETIRPYTAADLAAFADASGCTVEEVAYDYGAARTAAPAQFATVVAVKR